MLQTANPPPSGAVSHGPVSSTTFLSSDEGQLALVMIALGAVVIIAQAIALRFKQGSADDATRAFTLTLIIIGTLVLICAGYSNNQIAPALGLFGTIAGYLLGKKGNTP